MKILDIGKKKLKRLSLKVRRSKLAMVLYTLLVLIVGIWLGTFYEGRGDLGEFYFNINGKVYYIGEIGNDQN